MRTTTSLILASLLAGCTATVTPASPTAVTLMLDWVPNTNHSGVFVAQQEGYFADEGLQVDIVQPGEVYAELAVAGGGADFGVSFQEQVTLARADGVPLVSIAAILQHNTSAFAARSGSGGGTPAGWEGLRYGSFGSPFERPTVEGLMECAGGDVGRVVWIETGFTDPLSLLQQGQIDLAWIFYGWQGVQAEQLGVDLDLVMMEDHFDCIPDYYTPVLIASEATLAERPALAGSFLRALARGYAFAAERPDEAAEILLTAAPELDREVVLASQRWISPRYQAEAARWGEQSADRWQTYADWMTSQGILAETLDAAQAFSNEYLP
ncbi:MAG TPA: ABC transporter substrate-binding protein [Anaerolineales bacterium]|nr:ABC transporter substrate-binding protein [Anaerolineales bacterium]